MLVASFGVFNLQISLFLSFKIFKAKKVALVAGVAFLHIELFLFLKLLL